MNEELNAAQLQEVSGGGPKADVAKAVIGAYIEHEFGATLRIIGRIVRSLGNADPGAMT